LGGSFWERFGCVSPGISSFFFFFFFFFFLLFFFFVKPQTSPPIHVGIPEFSPFFCGSIWFCGLPPRVCEIPRMLPPSSSRTLLLIGGLHLPNQLFSRKQCSPTQGAFRFPFLALKSPSGMPLSFIRFHRSLVFFIAYLLSSW